jgi:hypothetical protein
MNRPDVEGYEALANGAMEGPWTTVGNHIENKEGWGTPSFYGIANCITPGGTFTKKNEPLRVQARANAAFIAASRTAIPELCAYVKHLEAIIRDWRGLCAQACGGSDECVERAEKVLPLPFTDEEVEVL